MSRSSSVNATYEGVVRFPKTNSLVMHEENARAKNGRTLIVGNNLNFAMLEDANARICRAQIDADSVSFCHC